MAMTHDRINSIRNSTYSSPSSSCEDVGQQMRQNACSSHKEIKSPKVGGVHGAGFLARVFVIVPPVVVRAHMHLCFRPTQLLLLMGFLVPGPCFVPNPPSVRSPTCRSAVGPLTYLLHGLLVRPTQVSNFALPAINYYYVVIKEGITNAAGSLYFRKKKTHPLTDKEYVIT